MPTGFDDSDELLASYLAESGEDDLDEGAEPRLWEDGREVGEWTVTGFLARGGNAEVYCAKHRRLGMRAALKVLWREGAGAQERFGTETRFLMGNPGPSFPAFHGAGVEEGRPWVAMELLEECPVPEGDRAVARYLTEVGKGVAVLHAHGWLHRDVKPRNILRRADGRAVLADFGLLKAIGEEEAVPAAGSPSVVDGREVGVGTPGYAAPEQFAGGGATPAADVYGLGMLAEECFGGRPPRAWEAIIRRATAALPRQRYPDVASLLRAIRRRHWGRNWTWAAVAALLAGALGAWLWAAGREPAKPTEGAVDGAPEGQAAPERAAGTSGGGGKDICPDGVHAARAAALARFDAEEWRREAVAALVEDLQENVFFVRGNPLYRSWGGLHEVTQRQWTALMDDNPSRFLGDDLPVDSLTFGAAMEFLERLNATSVVRAEGWRFRLPSAGEWMRCARDELAPPDAGDDDALLEYWNFTENDWAETPEARLAAGWFAENAGGRTHPVGEKAERGHPADLLGNVRELTATWGEGADGRQGFLCLGGSWADSAEEGVPKVVLEQPLFIKRFLTRYDDASLGVATIPSCYPNETCPAPGEIGLRLWAEPRKADSKPAEAEEPSLTRAVAEFWERQEEEGR